MVEMGQLEIRLQFVRVPLHRLAALLLLFLSLADVWQVQAAGNCYSWGFDNSSASGPASWSKICEPCGGKKQSPIDIRKTVLPKNVSYEPLRVSMEPITDKRYFLLTNSGDSLVLKFTAKIATVSGAGLPDVYYADEIHWHWGANDKSGSEHTVNGVAYPMEGHLVTYSTSYDGLFEALGNPNAVAVFATFYEADSAAPNMYDFVINSTNLLKLKQPGEYILLPAFDINYLLPFNFYPFYRYDGSLTTPKCNEGIVWTVFSDPVSISPKQMNLLRSSLEYKYLDGKAGFPMADNYRPPQPLNGRPVYLVEDA